MLGGQWPTQIEDVDLSLVGYDEEWTASVEFVTDPLLQMPFQGVLGSRGFFDRFVVTFNQYYGYFDVELAANVEPPARNTAQPPGEPFDDPEWDRPTVF